MKFCYEFLIEFLDSDVNICDHLFALGLKPVVTQGDSWRCWGSM